MINDDKRVLEHFINLLDCTKDKEKITVNRQNIVYLVNKLEKYFEQAERVQELEKQLQGLHKMYDIRLAKSDEFEQQNKRYRGAIEIMKSEIKYALHSHRSKDVKRFYLENAVRIADESLGVEE